MYLSASMFDTAVIFRGSFQSLRVEYRHTHGVLLLWKKKDTSHVFLRVHPEICRNWLQPLVSNIVLEQWWKYSSQTTPTTLLKRTPTSTLHRVFHLSRTTTKMMSLNRLTLHRHHHTFQTFLCQMNCTRRIPASLLMMIIFTHSIHHHDQMMTCRWWDAYTARWTTWFTTTSIITTWSSSITISWSHWHSCCSRYSYCSQYDYTAKHGRHTNDTKYQTTTWWSTDATCN